MSENAKNYAGLFYRWLLTVLRIAACWPVQYAVYWTDQYTIIALWGQYQGILPGILGRGLVESMPTITWLYI